MVGFQSKKRLFSFVVSTLTLMVFVVPALFLTSCTQKKEYDFALDLSKPITLTVINDQENFEGLDAVILEFQDLYPNCTVINLCLDNYQKTAPVRLQDSQNSTDLFFTPSLDKALPDLSDYLENLNDYEATGISLQDINEGLTNTGFIDGDKIYAIPLAADYRGFAVNLTLLEKLGLSLPKNRAEFFDVCEQIKQAGYLPLEGFAGTLGNNASYPLIATTIANSKDGKAKLDSINNLEAGTSELFREGFQVVEDFVTKGYWPREAYQEQTDSYNSTILNFFKGDVVFTPIATSGFSGMKKRESKSPEFTENPFEYAFICPPTGVDGTYGYATVWKNISVNAKSSNLNWANCFMNFLLKKESLILLASARGMPANIKGTTTDKRFETIHQLQTDMPNHFANVSQFSLLNGTYTIISECLKALEKPLDDEGHMSVDEACIHYEQSIAEKRQQL